MGGERREGKGREGRGREGKEGKGKGGERREGCPHHCLMRQIPPWNLGRQLFGVAVMVRGTN